MNFALINMYRLPKNGSDHYAMFIHLAIRKDLKKEQSPPKADKDELEEAHAIAAQPVKE